METHVFQLKDINNLSSILCICTTNKDSELPRTGSKVFAYGHLVVDGWWKLYMEVPRQSMGVLEELPFCMKRVIGPDEVVSCGDTMLRAGKQNVVYGWDIVPDLPSSEVVTEIDAKAICEKAADIIDLYTREISFETH